MFSEFIKPLIAAAASPDTGQTDSERLTQRWMLLALIGLLLGIGAVYVFLRRRQNSNRK